MAKILLVDDDPDLVESLALVLAELLRCETICAGSFAEALRQEEAALACTLALLDVNLGPGQPSGLDVFRWLRERQFAGRVVFITGHARSHPLVARAMAIGGATVVSKPISVAQLGDLVEGRPP